MKVEVKDNQNIQDIALQYTGNLNNVVKIALHNGISPTGFIYKGMTLNIPNNIIIEKEEQALIDLYKVNQHIVATGVYENSDSFEGDFDENDFDKKDFLV